MDLNEFTPCAVFDEFFEDRIWTILSENINKNVHAKLRQGKDNEDKDSRFVRFSTVVGYGSSCLL